MQLYFHRLVSHSSFLEQYRRHFEDERHIFLMQLFTTECQIKSRGQVILIISANPVDQIRPARTQQEKRHGPQFGVCFQRTETRYTSFRESSESLQLQRNAIYIVIRF